MAKNRREKNMEAPTLVLAPKVKQLYITAWTDPIVDRLGHDPRSHYVEKFWLGVLGPTTILLLRHCAQALEEAPDGFELNFRAVAGALGLGRRVGRASPLSRSLERACRFKAVRSLSPMALEVRRRLPPLSQGQISKLSALRQHEHALFLDGQLSLTNEAIRHRARRLALGLVECGDPIDNAEMQLGQWRFHPSIAADAVRWAWDQHYGPLDGPANNSN